MQAKVNMMGTTIEIWVEHQEADRIMDEIVNLFKVYEHRFSANNLQSELSAINLNAGISPVIVQAELYELIKLGVYHSSQKSSFLNIAIGPLVNLWRVGFKEARLPLHSEVEVALALTDIRQVHLDDASQSVYLAQRGMAIDLGALAKGYIADRIKGLLKARGVASAFINLGGNLLTLGGAPHQSDGYWHIGIQHPQRIRGQHMCVLKIKDQSVVTSGIYERQFIAPTGEVFHHIFDRHKGYPITTEIASLTIISKLSVEGEVWTTRLFGLTKEKIMQVVEQLPDIECIIMTQQSQLLYSSGVAQMIERVKEG